MKMVRVKNDNGQQQLYSKAQLAQLDKDQGRIRLNAHQHQSVIYLLLARYLLEEAMGAAGAFPEADRRMEAAAYSSADAQKSGAAMRGPYEPQSAGIHSGQHGPRSGDHICGADHDAGGGVHQRAV